MNPPLCDLLKLLACSLLIAPTYAQDKSGETTKRSELKEPPGLQNIHGQDLKAWASYLASDELEGRLTGSRGQRLAAAYIAKHFEKLGLEPLGGVGEDGKRSYFQKYPLSRTTLNMKATSIGWIMPTEKQQAFDSKSRLVEGFAVMPAARNATEAVAVNGEFVYAGLVNTRSFKRGVQLEDWTDKIPVFVVRTKKGEKLGIERQMMTGMFLLSSLKRRTDKLAKRGAKVAIYCVLDNDSGVTNTLATMAIAPGQDLLSKKGEMGMGFMAKRMGARVPTMFLARKHSLQLLRDLGMKPAAMRKAQSEEQLAKLRKVSGTVQVDVEEDSKAFSTNVVAVLRGSDDKLAGEALVYSAHMDHIGKRMDGDVFNGADDNASGSAGLMGIAKAFASTARAPRRSIIFLSVSGEELGLWGSAHYANEPTWELEDIVANINTDMIGRNGPESRENSVTVTPSYRHRKFSTIVRESAKIAAKMGVEFSSGDKYYERSDHFNFARKGIPVVFFCSGEHEDYHQVSDHADKLDAAKMQRITRLAYWTGYRVAVADERPSKLGRSDDWLSDEDEEQNGEGDRKKK